MRISFGIALGVCVFDDQVIMLWVVMANHNPEQTYVFTKPEHAWASVVSGVRGYLDPHSKALSTECDLEVFERMLKQHWSDKLIPFQMAGLSMTIQRIELDRYNPVHAVLREAYDVLDGLEPTLQSKIGDLFRHSIS